MILEKKVMLRLKADLKMLLYLLDVEVSLIFVEELLDDTASL